MSSDLRTTTLQKCGVVPRRARIQGSWIVEWLNSRLESTNEEEEVSADLASELGLQRRKPRLFLVEGTGHITIKLPFLDP